MKKKLQLRKETIANLENHEMKALNGGKKETYICLGTSDCNTTDCGCSEGDPCIALTFITYSCPESVLFCEM
ncbi:MAG: class I lanthipeptide [Hyphomicrobiales bacterium]